jgi:hypothetical protein
VLNLIDGSQQHLCATTASHAPLLFTFANRDHKIHVVCSDGRVRVYDVAGGGEQSSDSVELPRIADVNVPSAAVTFPRINFALEPRNGMVGAITGGSLSLIRLGSVDSSSVTITGIGERDNACRLEASSNGNFMGIGYGYKAPELGTNDNGDINRYEVADMMSGRIIRRLVRRRFDANERGPETEVRPLPELTVETENPFCACLGVNGQIIYAEPLKSR